MSGTIARKAAKQAKDRMHDTVTKRGAESFKTTESYWGRKQQKDAERELSWKKKVSAKQQKGSDESQTERLKDWVRVGSVRWCGSACFLSEIIIELCVPLCEKRGRRRSSDVTRGKDACYCHYRGNIPLTLSHIKNIHTNILPLLWLSDIFICGLLHLYYIGMFVIIRRCAWLLLLISFHLWGTLEHELKKCKNKEPIWHFHYIFHIV